MLPPSLGSSCDACAHNRYAEGVPGLKAGGLLKGTGCSLNIVFLSKDFRIFRTLAFLCFPTKIRQPEIEVEKKKLKIGVKRRFVLFYACAIKCAKEHFKMHFLCSKNRTKINFLCF